MPLYDYKCANCEKVTEVRHGFNDSHSDPCPHCGGAMTRVFNPAPIIFNGSGFYITDSRPSAGGESSSSSSSSSTTSGDSAA